MKFSVLMSIYYKEKPEFFNRSMESIWGEQTIKPNEMVLVEDGPLTDELYRVIDLWKKKYRNIKIVSLEKNMGLGDALNIGLQNCRNEIVARMDTDDISLKGRFEKQLKVFENSNIGICSSWVSEFDQNENQIVSHRRLPEKHEEIVKFAKNRSPINHPAAMYRKSIVEEAGGYKKMVLFEDYYLWARMMLNGAKFYNIQEPLINMHVGYAQLKRRSGVKYIMAEFMFLKKLKEIGFLNNIEFIRNISLRFLARVMPKILLRQIYKKLRE